MGPSGLLAESALAWWTRWRPRPRRVPDVVGAPNPSRPKAELGQGADGWTFQVQLTNVSNEARTYTLGGQALSENVIDLLFRANSTNWAGAGIDLTFSADSVTVPATSSATVTVTVTPKAEFASWAKENTPQGTFIDGAVTFTSADGAPDLTVPYLGFYGESNEQGIFDSPVYGESKLHTSTMTFHGLPLGQINPFDPEESMAISTNDRDLYIITRSAEENARTYATPGTVLLRDVDSLTYTYTNEAGVAVRSYTYPGAPRSRTVGSGRFSEVTTAESTFDSAPFFDGYDEAGRELPDGNYTLTIEGTRGGANPATEQLTHVIRLDTQAPTISNVAITGEGGRRRALLRRHRLLAHRGLRILDGGERRGLHAGEGIRLGRARRRRCTPLPLRHQALGHRAARGR